MLSLMVCGSVWKSVVTSGVIGCTSGCTTFMRVKRTCCTYFGIANSHGHVGEQARGHIEK